MPLNDMVAPPFPPLPVIDMQIRQVHWIPIDRGSHDGRVNQDLTRRKTHITSHRHLAVRGRRKRKQGCGPAFSVPPLYGGAVVRLKRRAARGSTSHSRWVVLRRLSLYRGYRVQVTSFS